MITRKPLNIDDDDLIDGVTPVEKPMSYPTDMAYFLQRCQLGEVSRRIVDRACLITARTPKETCEDVMDVDTELQMILNDMPSFLSMSEEQLMAAYNLNRLRAAAIFQQGHTARFLVHTQRCRLHLPFFTRGFTDMTYAPSKEICLSSARLLVQCELDFEFASPRNRYRFCSLFIGVLMSSIVLLTEFCINKNSLHRDRRRKDMTEAFRLLQECKVESEAAALFVDSLMQILKKHNLPPPKVASIQPDHREKATHYQFLTPPVDSTVLGSSNPSICLDSLASQSPSSCFTADTSTNLTVDWPTENVDLTSYIDDLSHNFEMGTDTNNIDWDNIFSDLGSSFVVTT
jgi:hypothetical protein